MVEHAGRLASSGRCIYGVRLGGTGSAGRERVVILLISHLTIQILDSGCECAGKKRLSVDAQRWQMQMVNEGIIGPRLAVNSMFWMQGPEGIWRADFLPLASSLRQHVSESPT